MKTFDVIVTEPSGREFKTLVSYTSLNEARKYAMTWARKGFEVRVNLAEKEVR